MNKSILSPATVRWMLTLAVLIVPQAVQAQWQATVGAQSKDLGRQALAFLPNEIWIHAGDNITWTVAVDEIHTVTFLKPGQIRLPFAVGCPGFSPSGSSFDGSACVSTPFMVKGQTFMVTFPTAGNYKLVCLVHANMTAVVHVLALSEPLPHSQAFYDDQAADERNALLSDDRDGDHRGHDRGHDRDDAIAERSLFHRNEVTAGVGEIVATGGGHHTVSVMRFLHRETVIHAGETVEWTNSDPVTAHTITFGVEPANPMPPSANVTLDADGARHATINSTSDSVHSGFIVAAPQERVGLSQSPLGVTRFRITFKKAGTYAYICALHDDLGMKGKVIVLP
jgi:plastocyanin